MKMHERLPSSEDRGLHLWGLLVNDSSSDSENVYCFTDDSAAVPVAHVFVLFQQRFLCWGAWVTISARIVLE